jgi:hypothetical protein
MATLDLVYDGKTFPVPRKSVFELLDHNRALMDAKSYAVQSSVPVEVFEAFVASLKTQTKISVTQGNAVSVWFLAKEFFLSDVAADCATFSVSVDQFSLLFERVSSLERQISSFSNPVPQLAEKIESQEEGLADLRLAVEKLQTSLEGEFSQLKSDLDQLRVTSQPSVCPALSDCPKPPAPPTPSAPNPVDPSPPTKPSPSASPQPPASTVQPPKAPNSPQSVPRQQPTSNLPAAPSSRRSQKRRTPPGARVEIPMKVANSLDGIISYLTKKHGGNVHEEGIVIMTSKSVDHDPENALKNVVDFTSPAYFLSNKKPGQWVCWDFGEMRVSPTHYTIEGYFLKSWVVEGSLKGKNWTEIDRHTDNPDFRGGLHTASFAVSNPVESRFIRLSQIDTNSSQRYMYDPSLRLYAVEFFGTLSE